QQASDVTWRLFDWGRPREIHVDAGLAVARPDQCAALVRRLRLTEGREMLVACRYFALERWEVDGEHMLPEFPAAFRVLTILDGDMLINDVRLGRGTSAVLPADLPNQTISGRGSFLLGYIPDIESDVRLPLLAAGHDLLSIQDLGIDL
ncbi:MAG: mannose-6-phosphate isomerase, partial [Chloroflexota bacterium]|nr:mannose-6-phosphate isomerase [Chloroflexota bacterium]